MFPLSLADPPPRLVDELYPEGEVVPEGDLHERRGGELVFALRHWLAARPGGEGAWVCHSMNVYFTEGDPRAVAAPDVAVAFGVNTGALAGAGSYLVWEAGAPPAWVLEIASPSTFHVDAADKPAVYAAMGVEEYWRLDPTGGALFDPPLWGARRVGDVWEPIEMRAEPIEVREGASGDVRAEPSGHWRGHSEVLGLDLCWREPKLDLFDPDAGEWLLDPDGRRDAHLAAEAARRAAEDAHLAEKARADAAEAELAELRRRLDPPGPRPPGTDA